MASVRCGIQSGFPGPAKRFEHSIAADCLANSVCKLSLFCFAIKSVSSPSKQDPFYAPHLFGDKILSLPLTFVFLPVRVSVSILYYFHLATSALAATSASGAALPSLRDLLAASRPSFDQTDLLARSSAVSGIKDNTADWPHRKPSYYEHRALMMDTVSGRLFFTSPSPATNSIRQTRLSAQLEGRKRAFISSPDTGSVQVRHKAPSLCPC